MNNAMLLAIDIGNSSITCGVFKARELKKTFEIFTHRFLSASNPEYTCKSIVSALRRYRIKNAIISSVVPRATQKLTKFLERYPIKTAVIGKAIKVPMRNEYRKPHQVGQDRLVGAFSAFAQYGASLVVVDFGTATTFDVVSGSGVYLGGLIAPGMGVSAQALSQRAALLPRHTIRRPRVLIGKDTRESLCSGFVYGYAGLCEGIVRRLKNKIGKKARVVATGGYAKLMRRYCREIDAIDRFLILKGLNLLFRQVVK